MLSRPLAASAMPSQALAHPGIEEMDIVEPYPPLARSSVSGTAIGSVPEPDACDQQVSRKSRIVSATSLGCSITK